MVGMLFIVSLVSVLASCLLATVWGVVHSSALQLVRRIHALQRHEAVTLVGNEKEEELAEVLRILTHRKDGERFTEFVPLYYKAKSHSADNRVTVFEFNVLATVLELLIKMRNRTDNVINSIRQMDPDTAYAVEIGYDILRNEEIQIPSKRDHSSVDMNIFLLSLAMKSSWSSVTRHIVELHQHHPLLPPHSNSDQLLLDSIALVHATLEDFYLQILLAKLIGTNRESCVSNLSYLSYQDVVDLLDLLASTETKLQVPTDRPTQHYQKLSDFLTSDNGKLTGTSVQRSSYWASARADERFLATISGGGMANKKYFYPRLLSDIGERVKQSGKPVLVVGDGDLSFARVLGEFLLKETKKNFSSSSSSSSLGAPRMNSSLFLHATTFDSQDQVLKAYPLAIENIKAIKEEMGAKVSFNVDAKKLETYSFDEFSCVLFNFPFSNSHVEDGKEEGGGSKQFDTQWLSKKRHVQLLKCFLESVRKLQPTNPPVVYITLLTSQCVAWRMGEISPSSWKIHQVIPFRSTEWKKLGYSRSRSYGSQSFPHQKENLKEVMCGQLSSLFVDGWTISLKCV